MLATSAARCLRCSSSKRSTEGNSPRRLFAPFAELEGRCMADRVSMCTPRSSVRKGRACEKGACQSKGACQLRRQVQDGCTVLQVPCRSVYIRNPLCILNLRYLRTTHRCTHCVICCLVCRRCASRVYPGARANRRSDSKGGPTRTSADVSVRRVPGKTRSLVFAPRKSCARCWRVSTGRAGCVGRTTSARPFGSLQTPSCTLGSSRMPTTPWSFQAAWLTTPPRKPRCVPDSSRTNEGFLRRTRIGCGRSLRWCTFRRTATLLTFTPRSSGSCGTSVAFLAACAC